MQTAIDLASAALVIVDPQTDLLSPEGAAWDLFGEQVSTRGTVSNLVRLRDASAAAELPIFYSRIEISADDYRDMTPRNPLHKLLADRHMLMPGQGARIIPELAPTPDTVLLSPRKGPSSVHSDMADQLRARHIQTIVIAGMVANLCVESHVRDAVDDGFNVVVVGDAVATLSNDAHDATLSNFALLATEVVSTEELVASLQP